MTASSPHRPDRSELIRFLTTRIAIRLDCSPDEISPGKDLLQLGLQSIDAVVISCELEDFIDGEVDPTLLLNHRTLAQIVDAFLEIRDGENETSPDPA